MFSRVQIFRFLIIALFLIFWQAVSGLPFVSRLIIAAPMDVFRAIFETLFLTNQRVPDFYMHLQRTGYEIIIAYMIVIGIGLPLGMIFGVFRRIADAYEPLLLAYLAFPTIVLFPLIFMIFGSGGASKVAYGVLIGFSYIVFNVATGIRQVDRALIDLSHSLGHSHLAIIFKVTIPSAMPTIIGGFRLGFAFTFIGVIVGEIVNASVGLGYLLNWTALSFFTPELYAVIIVTVSIGVFGDSIFRIVENRLMRWRY